MQGNWKNKLEQWAPEPPAGVWEHLSEKLEAAPQPLFAQKLQQYSEAPPSKAWQAISAQLNAPAATPLIRLFSKHKLLRYGSIAASVVFAFFLMRQLSSKDNAGNNRETQQQKQTTLPLPGEAGDLRITQSTGIDQTTQPRSDVPTATTFAFTSKSPVPHFDKDPMPTLQAERSRTVRIYEVMPAAAPDLNDGYVERYIVIPIAEDAAVRLPKKLYDLFRCGEAPAYAGCTELMTRIRQQSAAPSFVATADFGGLLELVQQSELRQ